MYGNAPEMKVYKGQRRPFCETCGREMKLLVPDENELITSKITNRCKMHKSKNDLEPCYYCHLNLHHLVSDEKKT